MRRGVRERKRTSNGGAQNAKKHRPAAAADGDKENSPSAVSRCDRKRASKEQNRSARGSQRGPPAALLDAINTNFPRRFLCCLLPLPIQCMHKPKRELVNIFVGDTAHLRVSGKSVCHFLQDFLTAGGSGTGFEKEWIFLKKGFFAL